MRTVRSDNRNVPEITWTQLGLAVLGSGLTVKALDIAYGELVRRRDRSLRAREFMDLNLDPLLKVADEVVGKLRSLAERDMKPMHGSQKPFRDSEVAVMAFLFAVFWARTEIIRAKSLYVEVSRSNSGEQLLKFFDCLESQRVRLLDRARQRAIGELLIDASRNDYGTRGFTDFVAQYESDQSIKDWFEPLVTTLKGVVRPEARQRILQYGVIIHAMIDTLDPNHFVTKQRPGYTNKLTVRTRRNLRYRVFRIYLPFVENLEKFCGASEKRPKGP